MDRTQLLYLIIELIIFCIPLGTLIWKAGKQSRVLDEHSSRIEKLEHLTSVDISSMKNDIVEIKTSLKYIEQNLENLRND